MLDWSSVDTLITVTAMLAAVACALPGTLLVLRRQSLMGDALGHALLPGIVLGYLAWSQMATGSNASADWIAWTRASSLFAGAAGSGILCALLSEAVQRWGKVEPSAALGVVFTSLFAIGLLLIRLFADNVDIDPSCVLYGQLETVVLEPWPGTTLPKAAISNALAIFVNCVLLLIFFKELKLCAFDGAYARAIGLKTAFLDYGLVAATAVTVVAAFESVGSILVLAMLVLPAITARMLCDRFERLLPTALAVAAFSAVLGHAATVWLPKALSTMMGTREAIELNTAGMTCILAAVLLAAATGYRLARR